MKSISYAIFTILILASCENLPDRKQKSIISKNVNKSEIVQENIKSDSINPYWNCSENININFEIIPPALINDSLIKPFNGKLAMSDINKVLILDKLSYPNSETSMFINFEIFGYSPKTYRIKNCLEPYFFEANNNYLKSLSFDNNKMVIIPYRHDIDGELTVLTIWKPHNDSLEFNGYYKNLFLSKYSSVIPIQYYKGFKNSYLLGQTSFGEGGKYGEEYWIAKLMKNNILKIMSQCETGGEFSDDTLKNITFEAKNRLLLFYENYYKNSDENFNKKDSLSRRCVSRFKLE